MPEKNRPVKEIRFGRVKTVIWKNAGSNGNPAMSNGNQAMFNTTVARLFKDPETDKWRDTPSLGRDDLLSAAKALEEAFVWIHGQSREDSQ